jgi:hypothetical protein
MIQNEYYGRYDQKSYGIKTPITMIPGRQENHWNEVRITQLIFILMVKSSILFDGL